MSRIKPTLWHKYKYWLNALLLVFPVWYFYQSLNFAMTESLASKKIGDYQVAPMPNDYAPPYEHDGIYVKDFLLMFEQGNVANIRQAYLTIGPQPLPLEQLQTNELGILHGTRHGQHVHALTNANIEATDKIWLTLENWQGQIHQVFWPIPSALISRAK